MNTSPLGYKSYSTFDLSHDPQVTLSNSITCNPCPNTTGASNLLRMRNVSKSTPGLQYTPVTGLLKGAISHNQECSSSSTGLLQTTPQVYVKRKVIQQPTNAHITSDISADSALPLHPSRLSMNRSTSSFDVSVQNTDQLASNRFGVPESHKYHSTMYLTHIHETLARRLQPNFMKKAEFNQLQSEDKNPLSEISLTQARNIRRDIFHSPRSDKAVYIVPSVNEIAKSVEAVNKWLEHNEPYLTNTEYMTDKE